MAIYKTGSLVETYRAKAKSKDINELIGRSGRPDLTRYVASQIAGKLGATGQVTVVDIGCGDGLVLEMIAENGADTYRGRLIGILPTIEEVSRVRDHLLKRRASVNGIICIEPGLAEKTNLPSEFCDYIICNSVIHGGGQTVEKVKEQLYEFGRIAKPGCKLFIGELPDVDELAGRNYGDSIIGWLLWVLKNQGPKAFVLRVRQAVAGMFSREPFVIGPKNMFFMQPHAFISLANSYGFRSLEYYRHNEIDENGNQFQSETRWDYWFCKA